ncbi:hypothetical protein BV898_16081 [Hypsibius exemplaris]|uniref:Uncharacterized protein n=1 Tax=Hypsibius exemplaris TaxID=2072580 RepID=A0A9X6RLC0_HYPEX|nr:hypothetical protein BV898_16081 [Hypsibius exemplaris]
MHCTWTFLHTVCIVNLGQRGIPPPPVPLGYAVPLAMRSQRNYHSERMPDTLLENNSVYPARLSSLDSRSFHYFRIKTTLWTPSGCTDMPDTNMYDILEIRRDATEPDIKLVHNHFLLNMPHFRAEVVN